VGGLKHGPLRLTDEQLRAATDAARPPAAAVPLPPPSRSAFLRAVAERLRGDFGDGDFDRALTQLVLAPGERIYIFTDGVTEANNTAEGMFGDWKRACALPASLGVPRS
jgi:Stage II sporulation protein E (SpoIIE)